MFFFFPFFRLSFSIPAQVAFLSLLLRQKLPRMISSRRAGLSTSTISSTFLLTQLTLLLLPTSANALNSQVISYILPPSVLQELRDGWNGLVNLYDTTMTCELRKGSTF